MLYIMVDDNWISLGEAAAKALETALAKAEEDLLKAEAALEASDDPSDDAAHNVMLMILWVTKLEQMIKALANDTSTESQPTAEGRMMDPTPRYPTAEWFDENNRDLCAELGVLDCPFCGGKPRIVGEQDISRIQCRACLAESAIFDSDHKAAAAWNKRWSDAEK